MKNAIIAAALAAAGFCALIAPATVHAQVNVNIVIGNPPPPARHEAIPRARPGYVWAPGYWNWNGDRHDWRGGHWERARQGQVYYRPQWVQADNGWRLQEGGWKRSKNAHVERHVRDDHRRDNDHRHEGRGGHGHGKGHGGGHCPPGQAKKGNC